MEPAVAAFDVDGTLTVRDCVLPFLWSVGGLRGLLRAVFGNPLGTVRLLRARDRDGLKAHAVRSFLAGKSVEEVESAGQVFAARVAGAWIREDTARLLREHQDNGMTVVLVSASLEPYLVPLGEILEVDAVLCTRLEVRDDVVTGELDGSNCRASEKARRLQEWAQEAGITGDSWLACAYGDSGGDTEMLAMAANGVNVKEDAPWD